MSGVPILALLVIVTAFALYGRLASVSGWAGVIAAANLWANFAISMAIWRWGYPQMTDAAYPIMHLVGGIVALFVYTAQRRLWSMALMFCFLTASVVDVALGGHATGPIHNECVFALSALLVMEALCVGFPGALDASVRVCSWLLSPAPQRRTVRVAARQDRGK